ncbi:MAG: HEAT repeat domain-containing protein [Candidatus Scalindua sp.]|nr:HEAT repeat domain-containing protein [Candidatus Scalindua sp.]
MKKRYFSFFVFITVFFCGSFITIAIKRADAEGFAKIESRTHDISPDLKIKIDEWMKLLYSEDTVTRSSAIISLLGLNIPAIYDSLIGILRNSSDDEIRISLIKAFGFSGDDKALDCIIEMLASEKEIIRNASADALGKIKTDRAIDKMASLLLNPKTPISSRKLIAGAFAKTCSRNAVKPLINLLESDSEELRIAAREALVKITKLSDGNTTTYWQEWWDRNKVKTREQWLEDMVDKLEEKIKKMTIQNDKLTSEIVQKTIDMLKTREEKGETRQYLDAMKSEYPEVRIFAANKLVVHKDQEVINAFIDLISDSDSEIRALAAKALGEFGDDSGLKSLTQALKDKDARVRKSAAKALGKLGNKDAEVDLLEALSDSDNSVKCAVAETLGEMEAHGAVEALINYLSDKDPKVKESVIVALGKIRDVRSTESLIVSLKDEEERVRWYAADSLGKIGEKKAVLPIISLLSDPSARVRESAATALGQIGDESAVGPLIKLLKDIDDRVVEKAVSALLSNEYKKFEVYDKIADAMYDEKDYKRTVIILERQIETFDNLPEYSTPLWQSRAKLAKSYLQLTNFHKAIPVYEELLLHFGEDEEIKHELVQCLQETKQNDRLLELFFLWIANVQTDNSPWWYGVFEVVENFFEDGNYVRVKEVVDFLEKKHEYMGGVELSSRFSDLREKSEKKLLLKEEKITGVLIK